MRFFRPMQRLILLWTATLLCQAPATRGASFYVSPGGDDVAAGTNWATARRTIQSAVDTAAAGDTVWVTNGIYATGAQVSPAPGNWTSNRLVITKDVQVRSVNGAGLTSIVGLNDGVGSRTGSVRCVFITNGVLSGFTLTNGAAANQGDQEYDQSGGGALAVGGRLENCVIAGCAAWWRGGGVYGGKLVGCTIASNRAPNGAGVSACTLSNCTLVGNMARVSIGITSGGGAHASVLRNCILDGNSTATGGSGGAGYGCALYGCLVSGNLASQGGGISFSTADGCTFVSNRASSSGGGAQSSSLTNCTLTGNYALQRGGGMAGPGTLRNCAIRGNSSNADGGGASEGVLYNCTVVMNQSSNGAGGVFLSTLYNSIVCSNYAAGLANYSNSTLYVCCTTPLPTNGAGNIAVEPRFVNLATGDLNLLPPSPCIDGGSNDVVVGATDRDGNPRIINGTVDLGAYEAQHALSVLAIGGVTTGSGIYPAGAQVAISTIASNAHWIFAAWNDGNTDPVRVITMPATSVTYTAVFTLHPAPLALYVATNGSDAADGRSWTSALQTIQAAVDRTVDGDTVWVTNGIYRTGLRATPGSFLSNRVVITNNVLVRSVNGPGATAIEGLRGVTRTSVTDNARCVFMSTGMIAGFTLTNGATVTYKGPLTSLGGGLLALPDGTASNCLITDCIAVSGGGVGHGQFFGCELRRNTAGLGSGALLATLYSSVLSENLGPGAASTSCDLFNCTVANNTGTGVGAGTGRNCIVVGNIGGNHNGADLAYTCTTPLPESGAGNFTNDPQFADASSGNFRLSPASPCVNAGSSDFIAGIGADLDGNPRVSLGAVDMGAHELLPSVTVAASPTNGGSAIGGGSFPAGTSILLQATPASHWAFVAWNDGDTNAVRTVVAADSNVTYTATFAECVYAIQLAVDPAAGGAATGAGSFVFGTVVAIQAAANPYWRFAGWNDGDTNAVRDVTVDGADRTYTARFVAVMADLQLAANPSNGGAVAGAGRFQAGSVVSATASPAAGWRFLGWSDGATSAARTVFLPIGGTNLVASFRAGALLDQDGDGRTDIIVYHAASGTWYVRGSAGGATNLQFGWSEAIPVPGDYDGDGEDDPAVYHPAAGRWYLLRSNAGYAAPQWGGGDALPVPADYDGDGATDLVVFSPASGTWYLRLASGAVTQQFGWSETIPVPGDYDGDGTDDIAVYFPGAGLWYLLQSTAGFQVIQWGWSKCLPEPADYDGDGKTDIAVYYPASGTWYLRLAGGAVTKQFGWNATIPTPGDFDGDGRADLAVYFPGAGTWYLLQSTAGFQVIQWGWSQALPVRLQSQINRRWFPAP